MRAPVAVAITGGIGAGKSEALAAFARHGAATVSSDEIVHRLIRDDSDVRKALLDRFGERILDEAGRSTAARSRRSSSPTARSSRGSRACSIRCVVQEYLEWREQLADLPNPPPVTVTEVPLLYEVGGQESSTRSSSSPRRRTCVGARAVVRRRARGRSG